MFWLVNKIKAIANDLYYYCLIINCYLEYYYVAFLIDKSTFYNYFVCTIV